MDELCEAWERLFEAGHVEWRPGMRTLTTAPPDAPEDGQPALLVYETGQDQRLYCVDVSGSPGRSWQAEAATSIPDFNDWATTGCMASMARSAVAHAKGTGRTWVYWAQAMSALADDRPVDANLYFLHAIETAHSP